MYRRKWPAPGVRFIGLWIVATASGSSLALLVAQALLTILKPVVRISADEILLGGVLGLFLGTAQWLVLRMWLPRSGLWVFASLLGGLAVGAAATLAGDTAGSTTAFAIYGMIMGTFQWSGLLRQMRGSAVWVPASGAAWALGSLAFAWTDGIAANPSWPFGELWTVAIMYASLGAAIGGVTSAVMAWMLRNTERPLPAAIPETAG